MDYKIHDWSHLTAIQDKIEQGDRIVFVAPEGLPVVELKVGHITELSEPEPAPKDDEE